MEQDALQSEFRRQYRLLEAKVVSAVSREDDVNILSLVAAELDSYISLFAQHAGIFSDLEARALIENLSRMRTDIRLTYDYSMEHAHNGFQEVLTYVHTGGRGRPRICIDADFLRSAYEMRTTQSIANFLGVNRTLVRNHILDLGLDVPQENPFQDNPSGITSYTTRITSIPDNVLDEVIRCIRQQHGHEAGISLLRGHLRTQGIFVSKERVRQSLLRLFPRRLFGRTPVERREYNVPGPNALWHHDGQHHLIRYNIIFHGFIDGYSRLITALQASNNNKGETVLELFLDAASTYKVPMRLRGDHGVENILCAAWMEWFRGQGRGAYIWGRSVHNIRIERLWVDVTMQVGSLWSSRFKALEDQVGLDINNRNHIWLLHHLFLDAVNNHLDAFRNAWNNHIMRLPNEQARSPRDMFFFDMIALGERGDPLPWYDGSDDSHSTHIDDVPDTEFYGVDWDELENEPDDSVDQPENMNEVNVEPPGNMIGSDVVTALDRHLATMDRGLGEAAMADLWFEALSYLSTRIPGF